MKNWMQEAQRASGGKRTKQCTGRGSEACAAGVLPPPNTVEEEGAELMIVPSNLAASTAAHGRGGLIQD